MDFKSAPGDFDVEVLSKLIAEATEKRKQQRQQQVDDDFIKCNVVVTFILLSVLWNLLLRYQNSINDIQLADTLHQLSSTSPQFNSLPNR